VLGLRHVDESLLKRADSSVVCWPLTPDEGNTNETDPDGQKNDEYYEECDWHLNPSCCL
jgi:hypothetical protein